MHSIFWTFWGELLSELAKQDYVTVAIVWNDVAIDSRENLTMVRIHLRCSKYDQFGAGANIILGRTGHSLCPITAIIDYIAIRGSGPGLFFQVPRAQAMMKAWFVDQLRAKLSAMRLPQHL